MLRKQDVTRVIIDKERAQQWLLRVKKEGVGKQRPRDKKTLSMYCRVMDLGQWEDWVAVIAFNRKGELINGQHALGAFLQSKLKELRVTAMHNLALSAYNGFDKNRKRSALDDLRAEGAAEHGGQMLPVATVIWQYERGLFNGTRYITVKSGGEFPAPSEKVEIIHTHPGIVDHLHKNPVRSEGSYSLGAMRAASWILHQYFPEDAPAFFCSFLEATNIPSRDHPISRLRHELFNMKKGEKLTAGETLARIFKAFLLVRDKQATDGSLLKKNEPFPNILESFPDIHHEPKRPRTIQ